MSAIYTYGQWIDIVDRGTSGDQVMDILASWKVDAYKLLEDNHKLEAELAALREQVRWRKYPEEMPPEKGWYPALEKTSIGVFHDDSYWTGSGWQVTDTNGKILFWMPPLPQPPEEK